MGTGIGINCRRCGHQLNYDDGFDRSLQLCDECASISRYDSNVTSLDSFDLDLICEYIYDNRDRLSESNKSDLKECIR